MNRKLNQPLLVELAKREACLTGGDSILVQPAIDGMPVENPIKIPGFDHDQIHAALLWLARSGYVGTGGYPIASASYGIIFSGITPAGLRLMSQAV